MGGPEAVLTKDLNGPEKERAGGEAKPREAYVPIRVCVNRDCAGVALVVMVSCSSKADATEGAAETVLWRKNVEKQTEGELVGDIF